MMIHAPWTWKNKTLRVLFILGFPVTFPAIIIINFFAFGLVLFFFFFLLVSSTFVRIWNGEGSLDEACDIVIPPDSKWNNVLERLMFGSRSDSND